MRRGTQFIVTSAVCILDWGQRMWVAVTGKVPLQSGICTRPATIASHWISALTPDRSHQRLSLGRRRDVSAPQALETNGLEFESNGVILVLALRVGWRFGKPVGTRAYDASYSGTLWLNRKYTRDLDCGLHRPQVSSRFHDGEIPRCELG